MFDPLLAPIKPLGPLFMRRSLESLKSSTLNSEASLQTSVRRASQAKKENSSIKGYSALRTRIQQIVDEEDEHIK